MPRRKHSTHAPSEHTEHSSMTAQPKSKQESGDPQSHQALSMRILSLESLRNETRAQVLAGVRRPTEPSSLEPMRIFSLVILREKPLPESGYPGRQQRLQGCHIFGCEN